MRLSFSSISINKARAYPNVFAFCSTSKLFFFCQLAEELLNRGVDISAVDMYGCHAVHYAALRNNGFLIKFLLGKFATHRTRVTGHKNQRQPWETGH